MWTFSLLQHDHPVIGTDATCMTPWLYKTTFRLIAILARLWTDDQLTARSQVTRRFCESCFKLMHFIKTKNKSKNKKQKQKPVCESNYREVRTELTTRLKAKTWRAFSPCFFIQSGTLHWRCCLLSPLSGVRVSIVRAQGSVVSSINGRIGILQFSLYLLIECLGIYICKPGQLSAIQLWASPCIHLSYP